MDVWEIWMTRSELIAGLAEDNPHLTVGDVERIVAAFFDEMTEALARGARVEPRLPSGWTCLACR